MKIGYWQRKCDAIWQKINKAKHKRCEACGGQNQVGHHWIEKSRSANLRYNEENLIPLCNSCHSKIHNVFGNNIVGGLNVAEAIIKKRGRAWKNKMDREGHKTIKVNIPYYKEVSEKLEGELAKL